MNSGDSTTNTTLNNKNPPKLEEKSETIPKLGIIEEDDEFDEFPVEDWDESNENKLDIEQWEADWDDDNMDDDFSLQLRTEMERYMAESQARQR